MYRGPATTEPSSSSQQPVPTSEPTLQHGSSGHGHPALAATPVPEPELQLPEAHTRMNEDQQEPQTIPHGPPIAEAELDFGMDTFGWHPADNDEAYWEAYPQGIIPDYSSLFQEQQQHQQHQQPQGLHTWSTSQPGAPTDSGYAGSSSEAVAHNPKLSFWGSQDFE